MSAKKSWDIAPRAKHVAPAPKPAPARSMREVRAPRTRTVQPVAVSKKNVTIARGRKPVQESKVPLKERRKKARKTVAIFFGVLGVLALIGLFVLAWLPAFRIAEVRADGPHAESAQQLAEATLQGTHVFILPRNSLFFIPESQVRRRILEAHPDVEAVSITAQGLTSLHITTLPRAEAFLWCGVVRESADGSCFSANAEGLIFTAAPPEVASTSEALRVYAPVEGQEGSSPVRAHIRESARIPELLRFVKALQTLGADIVSFSVRDDEADLHTAAGTRITYVLGREQEAAGIAASVFPQLSLNDGSITYVDLRFSGKAYFKRRGEEIPLE